MDVERLAGLLERLKIHLEELGYRDPVRVFALRSRRRPGEVGLLSYNLEADFVVKGHRLATLHFVADDEVERAVEEMFLWDPPTGDRLWLTGPKREDAQRVFEWVVERMREMVS